MHGNGKTRLLSCICVKSNFQGSYFYKVSLFFFLFKRSVKKNFFMNNGTFSAIWSSFSNYTREEVVSGVATTKGIIRHPHEYSK